MINRTGLRNCLIAVTFFTLLFFPARLFAEVLFRKSYQQTLHKYINQAEESIVVAMYFIILEPNAEGPVTQLVDGLVNAKQRGVKVKVVLENSKIKESRQAYQKLKENGVVVEFDTPAHLLHVKGVVIDQRYVFIGSANWSRMAIEDNYEVVNFTDSKQDAVVAFCRRFT